MQRKCSDSPAASALGASDGPAVPGDGSAGVQRPAEAGVSIRSPPIPKLRDPCIAGVGARVLREGIQRWCLHSSIAYTQRHWTATALRWMAREAFLPALGVDGCQGSDGRSEGGALGCPLHHGTRHGQAQVSRRSPAEGRGHLDAQGRLAEADLQVAGRQERGWEG